MDGVTDRVIVALDLAAGPKILFVYGLFAEGAELMDAYSGETVTVADGHITLDTAFDLVLLAESR
jgi:alpha-amylase